jgi:hypothetical protein
MRSRDVTTTAVGTSTCPIQLCDVNSQTAWIAETEVASVVRLSWARACLAVAGSPTGPSMAMPSTSALIGCRNGFHRMAAAAVGSVRATIFSAGDPRTLRALAHSTRPDSSAGCRRYNSWAIMPPME